MRGKIRKTLRLTHQRLLEVLNYNEVTGEFVWKVRIGVRAAPGSLAGNVGGGGYRRIWIDKELHPEHRLAWFYVNGDWPADQLDHINGNPADNRIANLRDASYYDNGQNRKLSKNNSSGIKGVSLHKGTGKWQAYITLKRRTHYLGLFENLSDAQKARLKAKAELHLFNPSE